MTALVGQGSDIVADLFDTAEFGSAGWRPTARRLGFAGWS